MGQSEDAERRVRLGQGRAAREIIPVTGDPIPLGSLQRITALKSPHQLVGAVYCAIRLALIFAGMRKHHDDHQVDFDDRLTITIDRTADLLDVGRSTVYELLRAGKLKGIKFGRAHRVVVQSIRDLVAKSCP